MAGQKDLGDDLTLLNNVIYTNRYKQVKAELAKEENKDITHLIGHSLSGSVVNEIGKERPDLTTTTYAAPLISLNEPAPTEKNQRYGHYADPISIFDLDAVRETNNSNDPLNTHSYGGYGKKKYHFVM
jgi:hypothetical protein